MKLLHGNGVRCCDLTQPHTANSQLFGFFFGFYHPHHPSTFLFLFDQMERAGLTFTSRTKLQSSGVNKGLITLVVRPSCFFFMVHSKCLYVCFFMETSARTCVYTGFLIFTRPPLPSTPYVLLWPPHPPPPLSSYQCKCFVRLHGLYMRNA